MKTILSFLDFDTIGSFACSDASDMSSLVKHQVQAGLKVVTGGHCWQAERMYGFFAGFEGADIEYITTGRVYQAYPVMTSLLRLSGRIRPASAYGSVDDFVRLRSACCGFDVIPKATMPAPAVMLSRLLFETDWRLYYGSENELAADIAAVYNDLLQRLYRSGCRFVQFDDCSWAQLSDNRGVRELLLGGVDVPEYIDRLVAVNNDAVSGIPEDMVSALYVCRGALDSLVRPAGDYSVVEAKLFAGSHVDVFYVDLNVDSRNDYSFLTYIPEDKKVMLGILSPTGILSDDFVRDNVDDASLIFPSDNLGITFRCGMAPWGETLPSDEIQWEFLNKAACCAGRMLGRQVEV